MVDHFLVQKFDLQQRFGKCSLVNAIYTDTYICNLVNLVSQNRHYQFKVTLIYIDN